ncbi:MULTISPECIES: GEVED domain-containing protein [unclassified Chryseobacterium]|uniref:GEVED domain-containing protein n=1 Tax=unclassified Chryseobacterium TaxID=2593645 RepID=UPI00226AD40F|nr:MULTISPECIES: GEVED domain-containing protein [unclassified Chryseobacterium]
MTKNLLYLFLFLSGISLFQSKIKLTEESESAFFCDTNVPLNVQVSNVTLTTGTVTWTSDPNTPENIVRFRMVGSATWSVVTSITGLSSFTMTGLTPCTAYEVQVAKICSVVGTWSEPIIFTTSLNYCASNSTNNNVVHISNITFNATGFPAMVSNSGASFYTDYRLDPARHITANVGTTGNTLAVSRTWNGTPTPFRVQAWIDFNANGIFDNSEMVLNMNSGTAPIVTSSFNIPVLAFTGTNSPMCGTTMRVIVSPEIVSNGCGTFAEGEVEDYGITFSSSFLSTNEASKKNEVTIYPNPASDILHVSGITTNANFEIYNVLGQKVEEGTALNNKINLHNMTRGNYFLHVKDKDQSVQLKFIKK